MDLELTDPQFRSGPFPAFARLAPEEMVKTLNEYFEMMVDVLFNHGGTLDKYVGDEIIGLFGDGRGRHLIIHRERSRRLPAPFSRSGPQRTAPGALGSGDGPRWGCATISQDISSSIPPGL